MLLIAIALSVPAVADEIAVGDRMRLNVFETFERRALAGRADTELRDFVERPDLGGEFVVSRHGTVFLPVLGPVDVDGLTLPSAAAAIEARLEEVLSAAPRVGVVVVAREPVYVTGDVPRPGVVDHVPGMTVLHALTLSGGTRELDGQTWQRLDLSREHERLARAQARLATLIATSDVLDAVHRGVDVTPSPRLVSLVTSAEAVRLVAEVEERERLALARLFNDDASFARAIAAAEAEIAMLRRGVRETERVVAERRERTRVLEEALTRRRTTLQILATAQAELADVLYRRDAVLASLARVEREVEQLRRDQARTDFDARIDAAERLTRIRAEIVQEEVTVDLLSVNLRGFTDVTPSREGQAAGVSIEIIRRTAAGLQRFQAEPLTEIRPGDMINVDRARDSRRASR